MKQTLRKNEIVRGREVFRELFRHGKRIDRPVLSCTLLEQSSSPRSTSTITFGISIQRSIRRAVDRNRIKRRLREAYRHQKHILRDDTAKVGNRKLQMVFRLQNPRTDCIPTFSEIDADMKEILTAIQKTRGANS